MPDTASLYDRDFFAWTQDQAARLRAWPEHLRPNGIDVENLVEEVESLGKSDRRAIESFLGLIAIHLLKIEFHPAAEFRTHWMTEVDAFRRSIEQVFKDSPSLRGRRLALYGPVWRDAARDFLRQVEREAPYLASQVIAVLAQSAPPRYDIDRHILADDWYPERFAG